MRRLPLHSNSKRSTRSQALRLCSTNPKKDELFSLHLLQNPRERRRARHRLQAHDVPNDRHSPSVRHQSGKLNDSRCSRRKPFFLHRRFGVTREKTKRNFQKPRINCVKRVPVDTEALDSCPFQLAIANLSSLSSFTSPRIRTPPKYDSARP